MTSTGTALRQYTYAAHYEMANVIITHIRSGGPKYRPGDDRTTINKLFLGYFRVVAASTDC